MCIVHAVLLSFLFLGEVVWCTALCFLLEGLLAENE